MIHRYAVYETAAPAGERLGKLVRSFVRAQSAIDYAASHPGLESRKLDVPIHVPSRGPLSKAWIDLGSDVNWTDHGGKWGRPVKGYPRMWWVIQFEPTSEWGDDAEETYGKYYASLAQVDLDAPADQLKGAMSYTGMPTDGLDEYGAAIPGPVLAAMTAEALHSYGAKEIEAERNGGAAFRFLTELAAEARGSE